MKHSKLRLKLLLRGLMISLMGGLMISFGVGLLVIVANDDQEVFIESKESKTIEANPVFNKIKLIQTNEKDIWMMNQSHHGSGTMISGELGANLWDRLAIVVDKNQNPRRAKFYQLEPGPLIWREDLKQKAFRVSCFICHNNGPRAIRPNYDSPFNPTGFMDRLKITAWNLKIKLYGRVLVDASQENQGTGQGIPFRYMGKYENETLQVKTCTKCHSDDGAFARGFLHRQQLPSIKFMLETGAMPPLGFALSAEEKVQLEKFLNGF